MGAGALLLYGLESRWKRQQVLDHLHKVRSVIHVIDMHQLTKDPSRGPTASGNTTHSPPREMTAFELSRYLDYCSELLSLSAKVAALYAQGTRDAVVIQTTSDLGQVTSNLSGKIWQKIIMIQTQMNTENLPPPSPHRMRISHRPRSTAPAADSPKLVAPDTA